MADKQQFPSEEIDLPSGGKIYGKDSPLYSGKLELKYMTAKEEDILTSQNLIKKGVVIDKLLNSLIVTPGITADDLLIGDKNALILAARILGYGKDYEMMYFDDNDNEQTTTIDLTEINEVKIDYSNFTEGTNKFDFELPFSKKQIIIQLMTGKIQKDIEELKDASREIHYKNGSN